MIEQKEINVQEELANKIADCIQASQREDFRTN